MAIQKTLDLCIDVILLRPLGASATSGKAQAFLVHATWRANRRTVWN
jgi:hypothetical protein